MLQLDELHEPLDIAQRTTTELEVPRWVGRLGKALGLDPGLDAFHLPDIGLGDRLGKRNQAAQFSKSAEELGAAAPARARKRGLGPPVKGPTPAVGGEESRGRANGPFRPSRLQTPE